MTQEHSRNAARQQLAIHTGVCAHAVGRTEQQPFDAAGQKTLNAGLLAFRGIERVGQQDIITQLIGPLLDGQHDA